MSTVASTLAAYRFDDQHPEASDFFAEVIQGLQQTPMMIPPKFLYNEKGSQIFDSICESEDYYPTRTEKQLLRDKIDEIGQYLGQGSLLVEPGSGNSQKARLLLDAIKPHTYLPMDISQKYLQKEAKKVAAEYPWLNVYAVCADYTTPIELPDISHTQHKVAFFPGSSIGNFEPEDATDFLRNIAQTVGSKGGLLIGVDLQKDTELLETAYNDSEGHTAAFNLNLLTRINNDLGANFSVDGFRHVAFYNKESSRVEMHLVCTQAHQVTIGEHVFDFEVGDDIHTECSYKYSVQSFQDLAKKAGFTAKDVWIDEGELFSLHYFEVE
ncbi:MAG: L-histidine N(alpha)-methyltransferase [Thiohalomonadales bacterium]